MFLPKLFLLLEDIMADVYGVTFTLIGILLSVPALLVALNLLLPKTTTHTYKRLKHTPYKSFGLGLPITFMLVIWIILMANAGSGAFQAIAFGSAFAGMAVGSIGGAGMARLLGERIGNMSNPNSEMTNLVRGAVAYEMACLVPIVGWFVFIPLVGISAIGAGVFGLIGWYPGRFFRSSSTTTEPKPIMRPVTVSVD